MTGGLSKAGSRHERLSIAVRAVAEACAVCRRVYADLSKADALTKDDRSPVTVADYAAQAVVIRRLHEGLGPAPVVAEETADALRRPEASTVLARVVEAVQAVWPDADRDAVLTAIDQGSHQGGDGSFWTLDPIDGTKGFLRGGQYAVSLAFIEDGELHTGLLGCPHLSADVRVPLDRPDSRGTIYFAQAGAGAYELPADEPQAEARRLAPELEPITAITMVESVERGHSNHAGSARVLARLDHPSASARADSQAKYAIVARGQANLYLRLPTSPDRRDPIWDHAAGVLLAIESGHVVTDIRGHGLDFSVGPRLRNNPGILCTVPALHSQLVAAIAELG